MATLSSIAGCLEVFKLKQFDTAIVDEASQILEPQLIGILKQVRKFILIRDQKQLPAIVLQSKPKQLYQNQYKNLTALVFIAG